MRRLAACFVLAALAAPATARANGRFPAASQVAVAPSDPAFLVLRTTFGVVVSRDAGATWDWVCESAIGYGANVEDPPIAVTANKTIVVGMQEGIGVSTSLACDWRFIGGALDKQPIVDVVVRPDAPHTVLALASKATGTSDAGDPLYASQVFVSTDDGAQWAPLGKPIDGSYILETLEVAANDPHRLYVSGVKGAGATTAATMFVSTDDGATWTPRAVPFDAANDRAPFVSGVDPTDADRVYVRTSGTSTNRLHVTTNAGQSFTTVLSLPQILGFAQSPDGATIFAGGPASGLYAAARADLAFSPRSAVAVKCLARAGGALFACADEKPPFSFLLGESDDDGATFAARLRLRAVRGPLACDPDASASACASSWPGVKALLDDAGAPLPSDAGADAGDAGDGGDAGAPGSAAASSCGCGATVGDAGGAIGLVGLVIALALVARRASPRT